MLCGMADHKTLQARTLGTTLREARDEKGLTLRALARELDLDPSRLSKWELGKEMPKEAIVARILTHLGVTGAAYDDAIGLTTNEEPGLWVVPLPEQRSHLAALLDMEQSAETITTVSPLMIPGLLQDYDYIRAVMAGLPPDEISTRVTVRLGRQNVLTRRNPAHLRAFVGEAALRQIIGSRDVMVSQLEHLLEQAKRDNVDLRVVPFTSGHHPGLVAPFTVFDPRPGEGIGVVVHAENQQSGLFMQEKEDVATFRQSVADVAKVAMSSTESTELIADVITEMRTG